MVTLFISKQPPASLLPPTQATIARTSSHRHISPVIRFSGGLARCKTRGLSVVTCAGASASSYVFAVVFPLSLLAVTVFTAIKIDDKLERDFREELAVNEAMRDVDEEEGDAVTSVEKEPAAVPRSRNRPIREVKN